MKNIAIIGSGSWGTALAIHLAKMGNNIKMWAYLQEEADLINNTRKCKFLPQAYIPSNIICTTDLEKAMRVVAMEAMRLKWEESKKYDGKSFNEISLEMIDGLSFSSVIDLAEDILKDRNKKEIEQLLLI